MTSSNLSSSMAPEVLQHLTHEVSPKKETNEDAEDFGRRNRAGETILYEAEAAIVRIAIFAYPNNDESCEYIGEGRVSIIFYPQLGEVRVVLQPNRHLWPVRNERLHENQKFDYVGWFWRDDGRDRMCKTWEDLETLSGGERGVVFGDWNYYGVAYGSEIEMNELKTSIREIQEKMAAGGVPSVPKNGTKDSFDLRVSRFRCVTGLRPADFKVVNIHVGSVWRINGSYSIEHDKGGIVALVTREESPREMEMILVFRTKNAEEVEEVRKCYSVPGSLTLVASHISPENKMDAVWEWEIGGDSWACAFRSPEEAHVFKEIVDFYVAGLKKAGKKFFGRK